MLKALYGLAGECQIAKNYNKLIFNVLKYILIFLPPEEKKRERFYSCMFNPLITEIHAIIALNAGK